MSASTPLLVAIGIPLAIGAALAAELDPRPSWLAAFGKALAGFVLGFVGMAFVILVLVNVTL